MPDDHKRKARPIAPATVTVGPDSITVVVPDVIGKNESHIQGRNGRRIPSEVTENLRESVLRAAWDHAAKTCPLATAAAFVNESMGDASARRLVPWTTAQQGAWRLEVVGVWPRERHDVGFTAPMGDADAAIPQALDALQHAGVLDDDARVVEVRAWNLYRKGVRATVMRLVRVEHALLTNAMPERDRAIAHLLPLVPQSPEPPAKPARKRKAKSS